MHDSLTAEKVVKYKVIKKDNNKINIHIASYLKLDDQISDKNISLHFGVPQTLKY